jgi:membrane protein involved in colicin uptake
MKKLISLMLLTGMIYFNSCGPSAEEKAASEKAKADSLAAADSAAKAAKEAATQDSMAKAHSGKPHDSIRHGGGRP